MARPGARARGKNSGTAHAGRRWTGACRSSFGLKCDIWGDVRRVPRLARFVAKGGPELLGIEAAILKEARLLCTLTQTAGRCGPELASTDVPGQLPPVDLGTAQCLCDLGVRNALLPQRGPDADRPLAAPGVVMHEAGREAFVADQPLAGQLLNDRLDELGRVTLASELAPQLFDRVLAPDEQPHGGCFDGHFDVVGVAD